MYPQPTYPPTTPLSPMPVSDFALKLAEEEKVIKQYNVGGPTFMEMLFGRKRTADVVVTNKRVALISKKGSIINPLSEIAVDEIQIDHIRGVHVYLAPMKVFMVILGIILMVIGIVMLAVPALSIFGIDIIAFPLIIAGVVLIYLYIKNRFMVLISGVPVSPVFFAGDPSTAVRGPRIGFCIFIGKKGTDIFQFAQEFGALIMDLQQKGKSEIPKTIT